MIAEGLMLEGKREPRDTKDRATGAKSIGPADTHWTKKKEEEGGRRGVG